jgi:ATP-dependent DNA helicase RecG
VFGTHALFGEEVRFARLALVIDEQHRFGVARRQRLPTRAAGARAVMTATPSAQPRAHDRGDLDLTLLADKPPGRG